MSLYIIVKNGEAEQVETLRGTFEKRYWRTGDMIDGDSWGTRGAYFGTKEEAQAFIDKHNLDAHIEED